MGYTVFAESVVGADVEAAYLALFGVPISPRVVVDPAPRWRDQAERDALVLAEAGERDSRYAVAYLDPSPDNGYAERIERVSTDVSIPLASLGEAGVDVVRKAVVKALRLTREEELLRFTAPDTDPAGEQDTWATTVLTTKSVNTTAREATVSRFLVTTSIDDPGHPANAHAAFETGFASLPEARSFVQSLTHVDPAEGEPGNLVCAIESRTRRADGSPLAVVRRVVVKATVTVDAVVRAAAAIRPGSGPDGWFFSGWEAAEPDR